MKKYFLTMLDHQNVVGHDLNFSTKLFCEDFHEAEIKMRWHLTHYLVPRLGNEYKSFEDFQSCFTLISFDTARLPLWNKMFREKSRRIVLDTPTTRKRKKEKDKKEDILTDMNAINAKIDFLVERLAEQTKNEEIEHGPQDN